VAGFYHSVRDAVTDNRLANIAINSNRAVITTVEDANKAAILGAQTDAADTHTDGTAISMMQVLKEISAKAQAPASTPVTGTFWQSTQPVSIADGSDTTLGAKADAKSTATDTTAVTVMQVLKEISAMEQAPASRAVTNAGTFAVQAAQSGTWTVQPGNTANTTAWLTTDSGTSSTGSAVPSKAGYAGGNGSGNLTGITVCDNWTAISQTAGAQIITGTSAKKTYICAINLVTATAQNIALVGGTGTVCATSTHAIAGGTTAATGWNLAANGGLAQGSGVGVIAQAATAADNVCILQSGSGQLSGSIAWTQY
jgi:hypothetical protein